MFLLVDRVLAFDHETGRVWACGIGLADEAGPARERAGQAAAELGIPMADADKKLSEIAVAGHANVDVTDEGGIIYAFPSMRLD